MWMRFNIIVHFLSASIETSITAHSIVLAAASSVFMNMLSRCSKGLELSDYATNDIQAVLIFIYSGKFKMCKLFRVNALQQGCSHLRHICCKD